MACPCRGWPKQGLAQQGLTQAGPGPAGAGTGIGSWVCVGLAFGPGFDNKYGFDIFAKDLLRFCSWLNVKLGFIMMCVCTHPVYSGLQTLEPPWVRALGV